VISGFHSRLKSSLFWDVTQRRLVVQLLTFRDSLSVPKDRLTVEDEAEKPSRNVGTQLPINAA